MTSDYPKNPERSDAQPLVSAEKKELYALSATLLECSEGIRNLLNRRTPETSGARFLLKVAYDNLSAVIASIEENF